MAGSTFAEFLRATDRGLLISVSRACSHFQLVIRLIQQVLCLLSVTLHIPFICLLGGNDFLVGLAAEALGRSKIRVPRC